MKECKGCELEFPATADYWHVNKTYKDGFQPYCKKCMCEKTKTHIESIGEDEYSRRNKQNRERRKNKEYSEKGLGVVTADAFVDGKLQEVTYTTAYNSRAHGVGKIIYNSKNEAFTIYGKIKGENVLYVGKFENSPLIVTSSVYIKNRNTPYEGTTGHIGYGKYSYAEHHKEGVMWRKITRQCEKQNKYTLDDAWLCLQDFCADIENLNSYDLWKQSPTEYSLSCNNKLHYGKGVSFFTNKGKTEANKHIQKEQKGSKANFIYEEGNATCVECEEEFPFDSDHFTRKHRAKDSDGLQKICLGCQQKVISRRYNENKKYGRELSEEERIKIAEDKENVRLAKKAISDENKRVQALEVEERKKEQERIRNLPQPETIECRICEKVFLFNIDNFQKDNGKKWGLKHICKGCLSTQIKKRKLKQTKSVQMINKVHKNISKGIREQLKKLGGSKAGTKSGTLLGCSFDEFIAHLNKGVYTVADYLTNTPKEIYFHLDHIIPKELYKHLLTFNEDGSPTKECEEALKKCWNYRNLRVFPMEDNMSKGSVLHIDLVDKHNIHHLLP